MTAQQAYSVRSAAAAYDVSETTLREAIDRQELPAYRVGRAIRIDSEDLRDWFRNLPRVGHEDES